jgi:hypothetical protein
MLCAAPMRKRFPIAPMSRPVRVLTIALLPLPAVLLVLGSRLPTAAPLTQVGLAVAALYGAVWLFWRPTHFDVTPEGLRIRFPGRARLVPAGDLASARTIGAAAFRERFGWALRIGVGGLFGGFGWLWTRRRGLVEFYVSRTDGLVLVERREGRPLLVTPADPEGLAGALSAPPLR